jgi:excinuclease ABC subunit C
MSPTTHTFDAQAFLLTVSSRPGVYRMLGPTGEVLYVGKAINLKKRIASYFRTRGSVDVKTQTLVQQIHAIEVTVTHTQNEALILENNLIKQLKPRYNILLRDDKSFPYLFLSGKQDFPRLQIHRGAKREAGRYFGPYPSANAAHESLNLLQKLFRLRQCEDSFFKNRSRPCLQYQIKRCSGPCVGLIDKASYRTDMRYVSLFLEGKNPQVIDDLVKRMEHASHEMQFERAAHYRDQITHLRRVQERQYVSGEKGDLDVVVSVARNGVSCIQVFYVRDGRSLGNKTFFPRLPAETTAADVLRAFIPQYYLNTGSDFETRQIPAEIVINHTLEEIDLLENVLAEQAGHRVRITHHVRSTRAHWLQMAITNAESALVQQLSSRGTLRQRLEALQDLLDLDHLPQRLECFDISHTQGEATVAACVVFDSNGPLKSDYRRFSITGITPGDDYAAIHQALLRRYTRLQKGEGKLPDVLLIDGGRGQITQAVNVLNGLLVNNVVVLGVGKGPERKPGKETLYLTMPNNQSGLPETVRSVTLPSDSPALHLIQQIRDEAHRFAITGHRLRRSQTRNKSTLEDIPGMGPRRRQQLLRQFGGLQEIARAGVDDLAKVHGISKDIAQRIYDRFHND